MKKNSISDFEMEKEGFKIKLRRTDGTKTDDVQVQHYLPPATAAPVTEGNAFRRGLRTVELCSLSSSNG